MRVHKTPGVYLEESSIHPNTVAEVATAVPAFIGHTQKADNQGAALSDKPWRIASMAEFERFFGGAPLPKFDLSAAPPAEAGAPLTVAGKNYGLTQTSAPYLLYYSLRLFYLNGGGPCYIVSVGSYEDALEPARFKRGLERLTDEREPTLVAAPEAVKLQVNECIDVQRAILGHCGQAKNRMAILDIHGGDRCLQDPQGDPTAIFRERIGSDFLSYGAAYYPWLNTTVTGEDTLSHDNLTAAGQALLTALAREEPGGAAAAAPGQLPAGSPARRQLLAAIAARLNLLPPSAALAGIYAKVDNDRGIWSAPANIDLSAVASPAAGLSHDEQWSLNVPLDGKAVNAIGALSGIGLVVRGNRTLDGNDPERRYIQVRRTGLWLEESLRRAIEAYASAANDMRAWMSVKQTIGRFLNDLWRRGALQGERPEQAFAVHVGLGDTMTGLDVLDGVMCVTVRAALIRPGEFIELNFRQPMPQR